MISLCFFRVPLIESVIIAHRLNTFPIMIVVPVTFRLRSGRYGMSFQSDGGVVIASGPSK